MGVPKAVVMLVTDKSADDVKEAVNEALAAGNEDAMKKKLDASAENSLVTFPSLLLLGSGEFH